MNIIGLLDAIFKKPKEMEKIQGYFKTLSAYQPIFTTYDGGIYEADLCRSAIDAFARNCSKLKPEIQGGAYKNLNKRMQFKPNPFMDTTKFLYKIATILETENNAFIVPMYADDLQTIIGFYPIHPQRCEVKHISNTPYLVYTFINGEKAAIELSKVGIMNKFFYKDDFFGENNTALYPTMQLISTQNQGIIEGVKSSANIRFIAKLANTLLAKDITAERQRFTAENLSSENNSGVMMFDNKYADVKQIDSKPFIVDDKQMAIIKDNVYSYFGSNQTIIQNSYNDEQWSAFYEGKIEPFAIQLSLVMSNMLFTDKEIAFGNQIIFSANRMQYMKNDTKLALVTQLFDRGFLTHNQGLEVFNMPSIPDGDKRFIRLEYGEVGKIKEPEEPKEPEETEDPKEEIGGE